MPKPQNVQAPPILCNNIGKLLTTKKLNAKFETVQILIAIPLIFNGKTSETKIQPTGPRLIAKQIIYVTRLPTVIHFRLAPKNSANSNAQPNVIKLVINRESFMAGGEIEDTAVAALESHAAAEDFAAL